MYYIIIYNRFTEAFTEKFIDGDKIFELDISLFNCGKNRIFITQSKEEFDKKFDELLKGGFHNEKI